MPRYSEERKQAVLAKLLPPHELAPKTVAEQEGIALATIYNWRRQARLQGRLVPDADASGPESWSARDKFAAVVETAAMSGHERGVAGAAKKSAGDLGGGRGRMISAPDRRRAMELIEEARAAGARLAPACRVLGITARTYQRWRGGGEGVRADHRPLAERPLPSHALTEAEIDAILQVCHEHPDQPPAQIIAALLDAEGRYIASEASFYRVLRARGEQRHRGRAQRPRRQSRPGSYRADGPCQVWCWDCTWLPGPTRGLFFYLFVILDIYSRKIVGWEVYENESAAAAAAVLERAALCVNIPPNST